MIEAALKELSAKLWNTIGDKTPIVARKFGVSGWYRAVCDAVTYVEAKHPDAVGFPDKVWMVCFEDGWGLRTARYHHRYMVSRKPTDEEALALLRARGHNVPDVIRSGGPVTVYQREIIDLDVGVAPGQTSAASDPDKET